MAHGCPVTDCRLEGRAAGGKQVIARVGAPPIGRAVGDPGEARGAQGRRRDLDLRQRRTARQILDRRPIQVARREIHREVQRSRAQQLVDRAHALEKLEPVDLRDQPHARDNVTDRDGRADLPVMNAASCGVRRRARLGQPFVEPCQGRCDARVLILQAMNELHREIVGYGVAQAVGQHLRRRFGNAVGVETEQAIGEPIGFTAIGLALFDKDRKAAQVFDQHDAQGDRHRPEFACRKRLDLLIRAHITAEEVGIEAAVSVRDIGPGDAEDARVACERPADELGQLAVIAGRQVGADLADLALNEMEVVD